MSGEVRLRQLEQFILDGPAQTNGQCFSVETLLDILICLYDECNNSPLRREKNILEYLEWESTQTVQALQYSTVDGPLTASKDLEIKNLKEEIEKLRKQITEMSHLEQQLEEANSVRRELDDAFRQIKAYEKQIKTLQQEREDLNKELVQASERLKNQSKELKDAHCQRKLAMQEFMEINERLTELHTQKQKLARHVRDKEEEVDLVMQKVESLRQELRRTERAKKEVSIHTEALAAEASKDRKLREQSEHYSKQLENELEGLKQKQISYSPGICSIEHQQEITKLKTDMEKKSIFYEEELSKREGIHANEIKNLKKELHDSEGQQLALNKEIMILKDKLEKTRRESQSEREEFENEFKQQYEREKVLLTEENKKLTSELDKLTTLYENLSIRNQHLEEEVKDLADKKESVAHWEAQITEIIQWVSDEKDARGYLQALASKMTEELEALRNSSLGTRATDMPWKMRRFAKLDMSARLELQSALDAEIRAKQAIQEELNKVKASNIITEWDEDFSVSSVLASDVIHASRKDIPCIFRVTASQLSASSSKCSILMLADSENERSKWVGVLNELHKILKKNKFRDRSVYVPKEAYDSTLPLIKTTQAAAIIGYNAPYLSVYSENAVDIFDVNSMEWIQTLPLKKNPRPQESRTVFSGSVSIPSITKSRPEPGRSMSASSGLSARSSAQNGSALKREFSGGSYSAKRQPMPSPSEGSLSSGGMDQGSDAPARDYDGEGKLRCHLTRMQGPRQALSPALAEARQSEHAAPVGGNLTWLQLQETRSVVAFPPPLRARSSHSAPHAPRICLPTSQSPGGPARLAPPYGDPIGCVSDTGRTPRGVEERARPVLPAHSQSEPRAERTEPMGGRPSGRAQVFPFHLPEALFPSYESSAEGQAVGPRACAL
ncbi:Serine/threonine-protein kinase MRCK alpha [Tupaia chinensis]|uniref:Serine/threonine-protein kinase MRCK alpha n=1 Tax=Tupaia chinensis TaxID=246437 RepID=L9JK71_TUPCH|nr:Serine/threonine-protein kinase MRCK alpha [Tupaia chinensis]